MSGVGIELVGGICDGLEYAVEVDENDNPPPEVRLALATHHPFDHESEEAFGPSYEVAIYRCTYVIGDGSHCWRYAFHRVDPQERLR